ncbi:MULTISPECIES: hypothetical protein [unclassified Shinella]|uniref:hypothetical protein n=1 Tax=unclassified Shinella TaxID=2643062 RepID=UPI00225CA12E|nr:MULTISPECIES: hypothetical protein [unclassified Shinella]MCO5141296.1 hypothetical protein [Shinella sp.]MDC7254514.1 hypothetical protein [Shinella sp. YE25]CAI0337215.1 hypothetical protein SHINE37_41069 [Rhizobiaceae bacterium]
MGLPSGSSGRVFLPQDARLHNPAKAENPPLLPYRLPLLDHKVVESAAARIDVQGRQWHFSGAS